MKDQSDKIGLCALEPRVLKIPRAPMASLEVQRLRALLAVNNLRVLFEDGTTGTLTPEQRLKAYSLAETKEKITPKALRTHVGLPEESRFSIEAGGETKLPGNATAARLRKIIGKRWAEWSEGEKARLVDTLIQAKGTEESLTNCLINQFDFDSVVAQKVAEQALPSGYYSVSIEAIRKILPHAQAGLDYTNAVMAVD